MRSFHPTTSLWLVCLASLTGCSREAPRPAQAPAAGEQTAAAPPVDLPAKEPAQPPAAAPSSTAAAAAPGGRAATEKYRIRISNYARTPLAVSLNGEWVGQWDDHITVPIEHVLRGKNALTVELSGEPANDLKLVLEAERGSDWVSLLALNFKGKTGSQTIPFSAR